MANAAQKKEIGEVVARWPPILRPFELPKVANDNNIDPISFFNRRAKAYKSDMAKWRRDMLLSISQLEDRLIRASGEGDDEYLREMVSELVPRRDAMITASDEAIASLDLGADFQEKRDLIHALGNASASRAVKHIEKRYRELTLERIKLLQETKDRLSRVIWDHDPDTRGGPAFDDADDLIAFLNS